MQTSNILGFTNNQLDKIGGIHTAREITGQPKLWLKIWDKMRNEQTQIADFITPLVKKDNLIVIFTGAGTSAFIGEAVQGIFQKNTGLFCKTISTTDITTNPEDCFPTQNPVLLISFARSGNSPESVKAVELANELCSDIYHFVITCNPDGALAKSSSPENSYVFILPPEANDLSLAMTGSFSSMLLSAILLSRLDNINLMQPAIELLANYGKYIIQNYAFLQKAASLPFKRAVFLGSGSMQGIARESHLKLQELSDGKVICKFDSFLGFRHGPKAVVDNETLLVYLFSTTPYVQKYEIDLFKAVEKGEKGMYRIAVMERPLKRVHVDLPIVLSDGEALYPDLLPVCYILPAQLLGFFKSIDLGLKPDNPSVSGTITRVVQGVKLYPYKRDLDFRVVKTIEGLK